MAKIYQYNYLVKILLTLFLYSFNIYASEIDYDIYRIGISNSLFYYEYNNNIKPLSNLYNIKDTSYSPNVNDNNDGFNLAFKAQKKYLKKYSKSLAHAFNSDLRMNELDLSKLKLGYYLFTPYKCYDSALHYGKIGGDTEKLNKVDIYLSNIYYNKQRTIASFIIAIINKENPGSRLLLLLFDRKKQAWEFKKIKYICSFC